MSRADIFRKALELEETIAALKRENAALRDECVQARRTGQYWKDEHAAANKEIDALRAREEQVAVAFAAFALNPSAPLYGSDAAYFAAFRNSPHYPKEQADG